MDLILPLSGFVVAGFAGFLAVFFYRQAQGWRAEVQERMASESKLLKSKNNFETTILDLRHKLKEASQTLKTLKKSHDSIQGRISRDTSSQSNAQKELEINFRKVSVENESHLEQITALTEQLKDIDKEKRTLRMQYEKLIEEERLKSSVISDNLNKAKKETSQESSNSQRMIQRLKSSNQELREILSKINPTEVALMRKKIKQNEFLFKTHQGQKEMLEERLGNWERALKMLATSVLHEKGSETPLPDNLGELVTTALKLTSNSHRLIDASEAEEETFSKENPDGVPSVTPLTPKPTQLFSSNS